MKLKKVIYRFEFTMFNSKYLQSIYSMNFIEA